MVAQLGGRNGGSEAAGLRSSNYAAIEALCGCHAGCFLIDDGLHSSQE